nr:CIH_HP1_G0043670.mRNA.1.CDS.1 [Saccharomyces cerevisiae]
MSAHTYKKFENSTSGDLPDKMTIYQDCMNTFNESPVNSKRCRLLISRLLRLLAQGETFPQNEATALFFLSQIISTPERSFKAGCLFGNQGIEWHFGGCVDGNLFNHEGRSKTVPI